MTGRLLFTHDVDNGPALQLRLIPLPFGTDRPALESPFLSYGQRTLLALPMGTYLVAVSDRGGGAVGDPLPVRVGAGTTATMTAETIFFAAFLEPVPHASIRGTGILQIRHDVESAPPARYRIAAADPTASPAAVGPDGRESPRLRPEQRWSILLPPGDYAVSARTTDGDAIGSVVVVTVESHDVTRHGLSET